MDEDLVIEGIRRDKARPLLHAHRRGVVITVRKGVTATLANVALFGGSGPVRPDGPKKPRNRPSGVENRGHLTLDGVLVRGNHGIGVVNAGTLRMKGDTRVGLNGYSEAWNLYSDGVHNTGRLILNGTATVRQNRGVMNEGTLVMSGASSVHNTLYGVENSGTMTMNDTSSVDDVENLSSMTLNDASRIRGLLNEGRTTLNDGSTAAGATNALGSRLILNGNSSISGRGVSNLGLLTLNGSSSIRGNHVRVPECGGSGLFPCTPPFIAGGGVVNQGTLILNDSSSISGNSVEPFSRGSYGGGVYMPGNQDLAEAPSLTMTGSSTISGNTAGTSGGGIYAGPGSILTGVMCGAQTGTNVYGNTPDDCYIEP